METLSKKWTPELVRQIAHLHEHYGWGHAALAREFGTTEKVIAKVLRAADAARRR